MPEVWENNVHYGLVVSLVQLNQPGTESNALIFCGFSETVVSSAVKCSGGFAIEMVD